jgi:hypothetical protein
LDAVLQERDLLVLAVLAKQRPTEGRRSRRDPLVRQPFGMQMQRNFLPRFPDYVHRPGKSILPDREREERIHEEGRLQSVPLQRL